MTSIVRHQDGSTQLDVASELPAIFNLARALVKAPGFMPQHLRNEGEITAVVLAGRELGLPPMTSIRSIKLIKGNVTLDASMQLALMVRAGCRIKWLDDGSAGVARLQLERPGQEPHVSRFTITDATKAGLAGSETWRKHPAAMLRARCVTAAGKAYCPDVLAGVYLPDELPGTEQRSADAARSEPHPMTDTMVRTLPVLPPDAIAQIDETGETIDTVTGEIEQAPSAPQPTKTEQVAMLVDLDLPRCTTREHLEAWACEMLVVGGKVRAVPHWLAFQSRCGALEIAPREVVAAAEKQVA